MLHNMKIETNYSNVYMEWEVDVGPGILVHGRYLDDDQWHVMGTR